MAPAVTEEVGLDLPDDPDEVVGVAQFPGDILGPGAGWRVAAQGEEAPYSHAQEASDDVDGLLLAIADTGQVSHEGDGAGVQHVGEHALGGVGLLLDRAHAGGLAPARLGLMRAPLAPAASDPAGRVGDEGRPVGHRDEVGPGGQEPVNATPGGRGGLTRSRGEQLQADGGQSPSGSGLGAAQGLAATASRGGGPGELVVVHVVSIDPG